MSIYSRSNLPNGFYVYAYLRCNDSQTAKAGTPYYIGKGKNKRAWEKHSCSMPTNSTNIVIVECGLTEIGSLAIERQLIRWYGRKDLGTGILNNRSDGGDSPVGRICSTSEKQKISLANKGRLAGEKNPNYGKVRSEETRQKISNSRKEKALDPNWNIRPACSKEKAEKIKLANKGKRWAHKHYSKERKLVNFAEFTLLCSNGWVSGKGKF